MKFKFNYMNAVFFFFGDGDWCFFVGLDVWFEGGVGICIGKVGVLGVFCADEWLFCFGFGKGGGGLFDLLGMCLLSWF